MPQLMLLLYLLIGAAVLVLVGLLVVLLTAVACATLFVAFVLHKLGWDRRLVAYLMKKQGVRVAPVAKVRFDDMDEPIEAHWSFGELEADDSRRPG
ncbi:hypothetical protein [Paludisphaera soli]|uniref:hypothetical protein n=1 Tax=Paludisphaera soli TaxID=2712865 RepID=UPI0013E9D490|nr:hypothetical protein [Paludisphaera soli]